MHFTLKIKSLSPGIQCPILCFNKHKSVIVIEDYGSLGAFRYRRRRERSRNATKRKLMGWLISYILYKMIGAKVKYGSLGLVQPLYAQVNGAWNFCCVRCFADMSI